MKKEDIRNNDWILALNIAVVVRHWRTVQDMTQKQLAEIIGTKQEAIARLESGHHTPRMTLLMRIAKAFGKRLEIRFK